MVKMLATLIHGCFSGWHVSCLSDHGYSVGKYQSRGLVGPITLHWQNQPIQIDLLRYGAETLGEHSSWCGLNTRNSHKMDKNLKERT